MVNIHAWGDITSVKNLHSCRDISALNLPRYSMRAHRSPKRICYSVAIVVDASGP